ncbi:MAG: nucleoside phosphorylase [Nonlabens sp.]|uniref:nucleoside phosphorylase n=1 Tax=Nonlabens sp. TaxID=1888209 RepID=UPI003EF29FA7
MAIAASELILNDDGSIYHLNLQPHQLAHTIITVGDPDRVSDVSKHFDHIEHRVGKREFHTHTGTLKGKRISVVSTGIGTDNIDIVFNELDALVNIDFETREIKKKLTQLDFIRIGTSGAVQADIPVDSFLLSQRGIGFDSLFHWYENDGGDIAFAKVVQEQLHLSQQAARPYTISCDMALASLFKYDRMILGNTITNVGFYGPQSRQLRLKPAHDKLNSSIEAFEYEGEKLTNLEMETAGIYAMSMLLGHRAVSLNAILANRATGKFSTQPQQTVDELIRFTLNAIVDN